MILGVVTTSYPRWPGDPAGNFVAAHVAALRAHGHTVEVIAAGDPRCGGEPDVIRIPSHGLFFTGGAPDLLERAPFSSAIGAATFSAHLAATVARRARRWDAIIAHWLAPSALAALPTRPPLLAIAHGGDVHTLARTKLLAPALLALRARKAELAFVSSELRSFAMTAVPRLAAWLRTSKVQPMGIDLAHFAALPRTPTDLPTLLVAARLVPVKGVDVAISALDLVRHSAQLVIAGDGPARTALENVRMASTARLSANRTIVRFLGQVDTAERDRLLSAASLVIVPSRVLPNGRSEGTPLIALEALAAGVPVVASAVGGLRDLPIRLVPPDHPRALATEIDAVLFAPPIATDLRRAVSHLGWDRVATALIPAG